MQLADKTRAYPCLVAEKLQMRLVNYAIGGATVAKQHGAYRSAFARQSDWEEAVKSGILDTTQVYMVKDNFFAPRPWRLYRFVDHQWLPGETASTDVARTPLVDRIAEMDDDADVVLIMVGTNDFYYDWTAFGEMSEGYYRLGKEPSEETFFGAMHLMMRRLLAKYRNKDIVLVTPIKRLQPMGVGRGTWDGFYPEDKNALGLTLNDYRLAIKEIADYYSVPCIDLYATSGLNPHIDPTLFGDKDTKVVHPNEEGHERMASVIVAALRSMRA